MTLLLVVANVFGVAMIVPQLAKLARGGSVEGISARWIGASIALNGGWAVYATSRQLWGMVPVSVGAGLLYVVMEVLLYRRSGPKTLRPVAEGIIGALFAPMIGYAVGGLSGMGLALAVSYGVQFSPAVWEAYRAPSVEGISATTWVMALVEAAVWLTYGFNESDTALVLGGLGGLVCTLAILAALVVRRGPQPPPALHLRTS